ncbi:MAG TPA: SulP family inorganic anion transporter [Burkholderiales bacterium]
MTDTVNASSRWRRLLPLLRWWPLVNRYNARADALAGLTGAIILVPQGVAFATIAGMPPEYGLYAAMVPAIIAALFGSSWHLVTGPSTTGSLIVFASLSALAIPGSPDYIRLALTLAFLTGVFQLALGLARMGVLVNFVSQTVITAYVAGAAIWIFSSQLGNFFAIAMPRGLSLVEILHNLCAHVGDINPYATAVGLVTLGAGLIVRRLWPRVPYMIVAIVAGSVCAIIIDRIVGAEVADISTVGAIPHALPPLSMPNFSAEAIEATLLSALVITVLTLTEAVSIARSVALRTDQVIDNNQTFIGQGLANIIGSFFSAYPSSGSFNRTGLNYEAGAKTPLSAIFAAAFLVLILLVLAPLARYLPIPSMAAILFIVAYGLINTDQIKTLSHTSRLEALVFAVTLVATLIDLRVSIFIGMALSLAVFVYHASRPTVTTALPHPDPHSPHFIDGDGLVPDCPSLKIIRINGAMYFGAANFIQQALLRIDRDNPQHVNVFIVARGIHYIDAAGAQILAQEARRRRKLGGALYFYRLNEAVQDTLRRGGFLDDIGTENLYTTQAQVIERVKAAIHARHTAG